MYLLILSSIFLVALRSSATYTTPNSFANRDYTASSRPSDIINSKQRSIDHNQPCVGPRLSKTLPFNDDGFEPVSRKQEGNALELRDSNSGKKMEIRSVIVVETETSGLASGLFTNAGDDFPTPRIPVPLSAISAASKSEASLNLTMATTSRSSAKSKTPEMTITTGSLQATGSSVTAPTSAQTMASVQSSPASAATSPPPSSTIASSVANAGTALKGEYFTLLLILLLAFGFVEYVE